MSFNLVNNRHFSRCSDDAFEFSEAEIRHAYVSDLIGGIVQH